MLIPSGSRGGIRGSFVSFLERRLPNRTKRLVFLASLTARLKESENFDNETLQKLNKLMVLCNSDSALKLPVQLSRAIWRGKTSYEIFNADIRPKELEQSMIQDMTDRALNAMPGWLRYGDDSTMKQDIERLLVNRCLVLGA